MPYYNKYFTDGHFGICGNRTSHHSTTRIEQTRPDSIILPPSRSTYLIGSYGQANFTSTWWWYNHWPSVSWHHWGYPGTRPLDICPPDVYTPTPTVQAVFLGLLHFCCLGRHV